VFGSQGRQLGSINEVLTDRSGQQYAVIGRGGFLGLGEDHYLVPMQQIQLYNNNLYAAGLTQQQLRTLPRYQMGDQNFTSVERQQSVQVQTMQ